MNNCELELLHINLRAWIKEKNVNKYGLAYLANRAIKILKDEIKFLEGRL